WTGGPYGVGKRIHLPYTRSMVRAVLTGQLDHVCTQKDALFGLNLPTACPDVPSEVLDPRRTWADPAAYDEKARQLIAHFQKNFELFAAGVSREVTEAGPRI
ncbi:MAG: phosphoenolpyruvate carboxykinase (ATP), partial [Anaerolineaceae bacterium]